MKKSLLTLVLALATIASTWAYDAEIDGIFYNLDNESQTASVTYKGRDTYSGTVNIPPTITYEGISFEVTSIGDFAFSGSTQLNLVNIPYTVTSIGEYAFQSCESLRYLVLPDELTTIGAGAFNYCTNMGYINIPENVTEIGHNPFSGCYRFPAIEGLRYADTYLIEATYDVGPVANIAEGTRWISDYIFREQPQTTTVNIPASVESIDKYAFRSSNIAELNIDPDNECYYVDHAMIIDKRNQNLLCCLDFAESDIVIPDGVKSIGEHAFRNMYITSVVITDEVTHIGDCAFEYCTNLKSVTLGNGVEHIGDNAFENTDIASIDLGSNVKHIGSHAFQGTSLTSVNIPDNITELGDNAFSECGQLLTATIGNGVTELEPGMFNECIHLKSVSLPEKLTAIKSCAFSGNWALESIEFPNSLLYIGSEAFHNCASLTEIIIPNKVTWIDRGAFSNCANAKTISLGESVKYIGSWAFKDCENLTAFYSGAEEVPMTEDDAFEQTEVLYVILYVPEASIADYKATSPWSQFGTITDMYGPEPPQTKRVLVDGIYYNFYPDTHQASVINETGKSNANSYKGDIVIPSTVEYLGETYDVTGICKYAFSLCAELTSVVMPNTVEYIDQATFWWCDNLTDITFSQSLESIGDYAFYECTSLASIETPNSMKSIGVCAFSGCTELVSAIIGANVTNIDLEAFSNCNKLENVTNLSVTPQNIQNYTFTHYGTLYVPNESIDAYKQTSPWNQFNIVSIESSGIEDINENEHGSIIYDLSGRRMPAMHKGINIIRGKKVIVR